MSSGWTVVVGPCSVSSTGCVQSPNYPADYGSQQTCQISTDAAFWQDKVIVANQFSTEGCCDKLTVNGDDFAGSREPNGLKPDGMIIWSSDRSTQNSGWSLCSQTRDSFGQAQQTGSTSGGSASASSDDSGGGTIVIVMAVVGLMLGAVVVGALIFCRMRRARAAACPPPVVVSTTPTPMAPPPVTPTPAQTPTPEEGVGASLSAPMKAMSPTASKEGDARALTAIGKGMKKRLAEERANLSVPDKEKSYPSYWKHQSGSFFEFEEVSKDIEAKIQTLINNTFKPVQTRDRRGGVMPKKFVVKDVKRIENSDLWRRYTQGRYGIKSKRAHKCTPVSRIGGEVLSSKEAPQLGVTLAYDVNEELFFHGTSPAGALGIGKDGLKLSFAGANAGKMYGGGLYFAECSSKSDEYASDDKDGIYKNLFCLLVCRVTLGETLHMTTGGEKTHKMIDASMESEQYDSVLGDRQASVGTYREFIVYEEDQVYPEYLILYKRDST